MEEVVHRGRGRGRGRCVFLIGASTVTRPHRLSFFILSSTTTTTTTTTTSSYTLKRASKKT